MKKSPVIHPFLFGIFPILSLFAYNMGQLSINEIFWPVIITSTTTILLYILASFIFKNSKKAGMAISLLLLLFFSYGHFFYAFEGEEILGIEIGRHIYLLLLWATIFGVGLYYIITTQRNINNITRILNNISAILVIFFIFKIGIYEIKREYLYSGKKEKEEIKKKITISQKEEKLHDIYYIVMDRYAASSTLKKVYGYDNSDFINYLILKGFYVALESKSNYPKTAHSLASSLNMKFISYLTKEMGENSSDWKPLYSMLENYRVWRFLKKKGYKFIHFGSWWNPTKKNKYADININLPAPSEFLITLCKSTLFYPIAIKLGILHETLDFRRTQWKRVLYKFNKLAKIPEIKEPTFVFAHILAPHGP